MKHILIFNAGYLPAKSYGGPVVSINNIVKTLKKSFMFTIVTSSTEIDKRTSLEGIKVNEVNKLEENENVLYLDSEHFTLQYINKKLNDLPSVDLVYANSFFNARQLYTAYRISSSYNVKLLIAPRGELEENAFNLKKAKKTIYLHIIKKHLKYKDNVFFQATTKEEIKNFQKKLKLKKEKILLLENIPSMNSSVKVEGKYKNKEKSKLKIVFLSRIQTKKNLHFALESLNKVNANIQIRFDIYGPIENSHYWNECKGIINKLNSNILVNYKGIINHDKIFDTFSEYDLFYFPTLSENFGHVIYEALTSLCPVLISDQTPWNDINETEAGRAYSLDKEEDFINYLNYMGNIETEDYKKILDSTKQYLSKKLNIDEINKNYLEIFNKLVR